MAVFSINANVSLKVSSGVGEDFMDSEVKK